MLYENTRSNTAAAPNAAREKLTRVVDESLSLYEEHGVASRLEQALELRLEQMGVAEAPYAPAPPPTVVPPPPGTTMVTPYPAPLLRTVTQVS